MIILTILLCLCLVMGGTFALFTDSDNSNIVISSGKVEVVATIGNLKTYSFDVEQTAGTFENGGEAKLDTETDALMLDRMAPGDKATFEIKLENKSNIAIQYRTIITMTDDNGLMDGLKFKIGANEYTGATIYSNWATWAVGATLDPIECSVELPAEEAGNEYQNTTCTILYKIEAVQGNVATDNNVAKIGDTKYESLEQAIAALEENDTLEIIRPGTYAPFTISKNNVTVKGIVGATKAESTVIKNTATDKIILGAGEIVDDSNPTVGEIHNLKAVDGVKLENLWVDSTATSSLNSWDLDMAFVITAYYEIASSIATNVTITGCYIEGNGSQTMAMGLGDGLSFTNNTVKNFSTGFYAETNAIKTQTISGNIFEGVNSAISYVMSMGGEADITIKDNTVVDTTVFTLWDYAQWQGRNSTEEVASAFKNLTVSGNNGDICYNLTHFNYKAATPVSVTMGTGNQSINYINGVAFDIPFADKGNYTITNTDGSALDRATQGRNTLADEAITVGGVDKAACYELAKGDYLLVDNTTGNKIPFSVTDPVVGVQQFIEMPKVATVGTAADLRALIEEGFQNGNTGDVYIQLSGDIDVNKEWDDFKIPNTANNITIDGKGYTIFNLNKPLITATWGGSGTTTFQNLTIENADIQNYNSAEVKGSLRAVGALMAYVDAGEKVTINNCHLINSDIIGQADADEDKGTSYAGGFIGYSSQSKIEFNECTVSGSTLYAQKSVGGLIGHIGGGNITINECAVENSKLRGFRNNETDVGEVFGRSSGSNTVTMTNITYNGNTITKAYGTENQASVTTSKIYGSLNGYTATLNGNSV